MAGIILEELEEFERCGAGRIPARTITVNRDAAAGVMRAVRAEQAARTALAHGPFQAYARATVNGSPGVFLFSRESIPDHESALGCEFVSYFSPKGRLAEETVGSSLTIRVPAGELQFDVQETNRFSCVKREAWDAVNNNFASVWTGVQFFKSLRDFLSAPQSGERIAFQSTVPSEEENRFRQELEDASRRGAEARDELFRELAGRIRASQEVLNAFELRDQAILDGQQGTVFRRPLGTRLVVTGAPGTGKTTVLIKRIAQKTHPDGLTAEEKERLTEQQIASLLDRDKSWVLFTPTDLLRNYIKEALAKEHLPATQQTVLTWADKRLRLARDVFRVLRTGNVGRFRRARENLVALPDAKSAAEFLAAFRVYWRDAIKRQLEDRWRVIADLRDAVEGVSPIGIERSRSTEPYRELMAAVATMLGQLHNVEERGGARAIAVAELGLSARDAVRSVRRALDRFVGEAALEVALQVQQLLVRSSEGESYEEALKRLSQGLLSGAIPSDSEPGSTDVSDPLESVPNPVLRERILVARTIHAGLGAAERLTAGFDTLFGDTISLYGEFRNGLTTSRDPVAKLLTEAGRRSESAAYISDPELDVLLYVLLSTADTLFDRTPGLLWREALPGTLGRVRSELRAVVTVDEASDFSPMQLGCMYYLAHPTTRAFSMSGDLMQRVTSGGLRDWDECREFAPDLELHELRLVYRQNRALLRIAAELYQMVMGHAAPFDSPLADRPEPIPLLARQSSQADSATWVATRIVEIYGICGRLPSIGVFVPEEAQVKPVASLLAEALTEHAIDVEACEGGKVLGTGDRVRVFSIEHIKGLEFHAVFLVDFDQLDAWDAELADKYLYVGLTRAAEFLGVTVRNALPPQLEPVADHFSDGTWEGFGAAGNDSN